MAIVDGKWNCSVASPMGEQPFALTVTSQGSRFSGTLDGSFGSKEIADGAIDGDALKWTMHVSQPMPLTLTCEAAVSGDTLNGKVKAGIFGSFPLTGTRA
jgi:hypothetical protein